MNFVKKILPLIFLICMLFSANAEALTIEYSGASHEYTGLLCSLTVDGKKVETPLMPPIIINDRTLIPVRELCEALGAYVTYTAPNIKIEYDGNLLQMAIGNNTAYFNGVAKNIPDGVTPLLINYPGEYAKTMVPVRFIAETFGMAVRFDSSNAIVAVYKNAASAPAEEVQQPTVLPEKPAENTGTPTITGTNFSFPTAVKLQLAVNANSPYTADPTSFTLPNPNRIVFDIPNTSLNLAENSIPVVGSPITAIRFGHDQNKTRVVIDVSGIIKNYKAERKGSVINISAEVAYENAQPTPSAPAPSTGPVAAPENGETTSKKTIVIDAGHGGDDSGAVSNVLGYTLKEKDITLSIATKVKDILTSSGYNVVMTRSSDTYPTLSQRAELANKQGAAIFVSIHMNSATTEQANGTETYYATVNNGSAFGATSAQLAKNIQTRLQSALSSRNRGVKTANHAVTKNSLMPAALVEVGFISNTEEAAKLATDSYQNLAASAIADGIAATWAGITMPTDWNALANERAEALK